MHANLAFLILPTLTLVAGVVDDLRSRKVHNWLVLTAAGVNIAGTTLLGGWPALQNGLVAASLAVALMLPLVAINALGAGDLKILAAFALATHWSAVLSVVMYSLVWGAVLGVFQAALRKQLGSLVKGVVGIVRRKSTSTNELHKIPFTVALAFGWLTYLSMTNWAGG